MRRPAAEPAKPGGTLATHRLLRGRTRKNACRAARILRLAAYSLARANSALGAFYRRLRTRREPATDYRPYSLIGRG